MGKDVVDAFGLEGFEAGKNPIALALEWGVRRMGEQLELRSALGPGQAGHGRRLSGVRRGRRPARGAVAPLEALPRRKPGVSPLGERAPTPNASREAETGGSRNRTTSSISTRLEGQRSVSTQSSQRGRRASQTRRPCQISRCGNRPQSARGTSLTRSRSILTGSSCRVSPSRCESRRTCVSTTTPCGLPSSAATTFAVFRATPGQPQQLVDRPRHLAVELLQQHAHRAADRLRLLAEEAGRVDVPLELLARHGEVVLRPPVLLEQRRSVTRLTFTSVVCAESITEIEQLERVAEVERDPRVRVLDREPLDDRPDPIAPAARPAGAPRGRSYVATLSK